MIIKKFQRFNENLFGIKWNRKIEQSNIDNCVQDILEFIKDNGYETWDDFVEINTFGRKVVNMLIDNNCKNMDEVKEVKFLIRLKLSDITQLEVMLKEYEKLEDYEKCQIIKSQIENKKPLNWVVFFISLFPRLTIRLKYLLLFQKP